ncbi:hypothetical protein OROHE_016855 [Orobanche hederae]
MAARSRIISLSCGMVLSSLSPCLDYLRGGGSVTPSCCDGLKSVNNAAGTTPDLRAACECVKTLVPSAGSNPDFVNTLPGICPGPAQQAPKFLGPALDMPCQHSLQLLLIPRLFQVNSLKLYDGRCNK